MYMGFFTAVSAVGIRVRLFVSALMALVSGYPCTSHLLVSCCVLATRQPSVVPHALRFLRNQILYRLYKSP